MKHWKVVESKFGVYYISHEDFINYQNDKFGSLEIIKSNLTRKEAFNFWKILNKLRRL